MEKANLYNLVLRGNGVDIWFAIMLCAIQQIDSREMDVPQ